MSFRLGLTGSVGMGKSTTAEMFRTHGIPVWDADETVARLYAKGGAAVSPVAAAFPAALSQGAIDRARLRALLHSDEDFARLNAIVHPLVAQDRAHWGQHTSADIVVFDIPLLFENDLQHTFDGVAVVHVERTIQHRRVLQRPGMTRAALEKIEGQQWPSARKLAQADYIIPTDTLEGAQHKVVEILADIRQKRTHA